MYHEIIDDTAEQAGNDYGKRERIMVYNFSCVLYG